MSATDSMIHADSEIMAPPSPSAESRFLAKKRKVSREEAENAVRTLILWAGDDPSRDGLLETPARVVRAWEEIFAGYRADIDGLMARDFENTHRYREPVILRNIRLESYCEHHLMPIIGQAHIAYCPQERVIGISKLARLAEAFSRRLQIQESLTVEIAETLNKGLKPLGVAVVIDAEHHCMTMRGVHKHEARMRTQHFLGNFAEDSALRESFLRSLRAAAPG